MCYMKNAGQLAPNFSVIYVLQDLTICQKQHLEVDLNESESQILGLL